MTRFPLPRLVPAVLGALHFIAAPCAMAMTVAAMEEPCEHCPADTAPCVTTAGETGTPEVAPAPARPPVPTGPATAPVALPPVADLAIIPAKTSPRRRIAFATGRHSGDPPLSVLYQKFLN